jgi:hypothetical protein
MQKEQVFLRASGHVALCVLREISEDPSITCHYNLFMNPAMSVLSYHDFHLAANLTTSFR